MMRAGVLLASIAFGLTGSSVAAQDRKGITFFLAVARAVLVR
jgi:hypothetical protein